MLQGSQTHTVPYEECLLSTEWHRCSLKQVIMRETVWASFRNPDMLTLAEREKNRSGCSLLNHCFMSKLASSNAVHAQGKEHACRQTLPLHRLNACCLKVVCVIVRVEFSPLCLNMPVFNKFCLNYRPFFCCCFFFFSNASFVKYILFLTLWSWQVPRAFHFLSCQSSHFLSDCNEVDMFYLVAAKIK